MAQRIKVRDSKSSVEHLTSKSKVCVYALIHLFVLTPCLSVSQPQLSII